MVQYLLPPGYTWSKFIQNDYDSLARLTNSMLYTSMGLINQHGYEMNAAHQRTRQTFSDGNSVGNAHFVDYTYDSFIERCRHFCLLKMQGGFFNKLSAESRNKWLWIQRSKFNGCVGDCSNRAPYGVWMLHFYVCTL
ncbi:MAG: hypothetical protein M9920_16035 [Verrucomicrobiae bacterium]|nr:hypothetical protein [Verrucomicrobiae bacterium]